jgi:VIT1/CCC1 family predicted Fe2+/Mn2+ transporter
VTTGEAVDMIPSYGPIAESSVASDVVYVNGPLLTISVFVFIFLFVAMTDNYLFVGCGLFVVLVSALFALLVVAITCGLSADVSRWSSSAQRNAGWWSV